MRAPFGPGGYHLQISAGGGQQRTVQVDTGSTGIALWREFIGQSSPMPNPPKNNYIYYNSSQKGMCGRWVTTAVELRDALDG